MTHTLNLNSDLLLLDKKSRLKVTTRHFDQKTLLQLEGLYLCYYDEKWINLVPKAQAIWSRMGKQLPDSLQFGANSSVLVQDGNTFFDYVSM